MKPQIGRSKLAQSQCAMVREMHEMRVLQWQIMHMGKRWMSCWENSPHKKATGIGSGLE